MRKRDQDRISDMSSVGGGGDYIVISEHEGSDGRYFRRSGCMSREYAEDRLRWIIEREGALSATLAQVVVERERRYESVEVDRSSRDLLKAANLGATAKQRT